MRYRYFGIQTKFFFLFLVSILISSLLVGICSYFISLSILKNKVSESHRSNVSFVAGTVKHELSRIEQISNYLYVDSDIKELLERENHNDYQATKIKENIEKNLNSLVMTSDFRSYRLIQIRSNHEILLNYSPSINNKSYSFDPDSLYHSFFLQSPSRLFELEKHEESLYYDYLTGEPLLVSARQILDSTYCKEIGQIFLALSPEIFSNIESFNSGVENSRLYLLDAENHLINSSEFKREPLIDEVLKQPYEFTEMEISHTLIFYEKIDPYGWKVLGMIPIDDLSRDSQSILLAILLGLLAGMMLSFILWHFLSYKIYYPLGELKKAVREVEKGNLQARAPVISNDEIGELSQNFNHMICQINDLFDKVIDEQSRLKDAQYKALRAQINPHFLYNTLSSIRWMAIIHKADNIKIMVDTLVRLLKNSAKKDNTMVRVADELQTVRDYVFIQKLAYGCKFDLTFDVPKDLEDYPCIGFLFQPIVENAIFHGIEPKQGGGTITLSGRKGNLNGKTCLIFTITDDGVGMTEKAISAILKKDSSNKYGLNGIGVANVNDRLMLTYGSEYHVEYKSELGKYTSVIIRIPIV